MGAAPAPYTALSAISPPRLRPLMFSLLGLMVAVMGGIAGGVLMARGATTIEDDIAQVAEESAGDPLAAFL